MSPSGSVLQSAIACETVTDFEGRRISIRKPTALDKLRLLKAAGPVLAHNEAWLGMAILACAVTAIDDVPVPMPANEQQIEALVGRLGDAGIAAVAEAEVFSNLRQPNQSVDISGN